MAFKGAEVGSKIPLTPLNEPLAAGVQSRIVHCNHSNSDILTYP